MTSPSHALTLRPFPIPSHVVAELPPRPRQEGAQALPQFSLGELSDETLNQMCLQFRQGIFARAIQQRAEADSKAQIVRKLQGA